MPVFQTMDALEDSILSAGLAPLFGDITATARPVILLTRTQMPDDPLPGRVSKIGGNPDLPPEFAWPHRPARPDGERQAAAERKLGVHLRESMARYGRHTEAQLDAILDRYEQRAESHLRAFPLAFQAQLNLGVLSREEGFDPTLPDTGLLSIFFDATGGDEWQPCAFWHPGSTFVRTPVPLPLVDWYDLEHPFYPGSPDTSWRTLTMAERFTPFSAICIPGHWLTPTPHYAPDPRLLAWRETMVEYSPDTPEDGTSSNFGDRLGGWPLNLQGNPEDSVLADAEKVVTPGQTPWRHLFCWGGEAYGDTRLIPWESLGDGNASLLVRDEDLAARRFDQAVTVIQRT